MSLIRQGFDNLDKQKDTAQHGRQIVQTTEPVTVQLDLWHEGN